ncbi:Uncharacterised protein [Acinetobacter baumannii]|nr:Uncharacterised protein [Acinetobacter baumannii]
MRVLRRMSSWLPMRITTMLRTYSSKDIMPNIPSMISVSINSVISLREGSTRS